MKTNKIAKFTAAMSALLLTGNLAFGQSVGDVIQAKFPETVGNLAISNSTTYNPKLKNDYRNLYSKLANGLEEIEKFKLGGADAEILSIFDLKTLKDLQKAGALDELESGMKSEQHKIVNLMRDKEKYGADSIRCTQNMSMFTEFVKQNSLDDAYNSWTILVNEYPISTSNIYQTSGMKVWKNQYDKASTADKEKWVDTLMLLYDNRIKYFTTAKYPEYYVLGRKGCDLAKYRKEPIEPTYEILTKAVDLGGKKSESTVILTAMQSVIKMYGAEKIDASVVVDKYLAYSEILNTQKGEYEKQVQNAANDKDKSKANDNLTACNLCISNVDKLFSNSSAAQCEVLNKAFLPRFQANPKDVELLRKIVKILDNKGCTDLKLYEDATVNLVGLEPSELACYNLAKMMEKKDKVDDAIANYEKAINYSTVDTMKAIYNFNIGRLLQKQNKYSQARSYYLKAKDLKQNYGAPYMMIAVMYAQTANSIGESSFEHSQVYWLVVDKLNIARQDPTIANEVNKLIAQYRNHFPNQEEAFMHSITEGKSVTIGGWIGETTTARFK